MSCSWNGFEIIVWEVTVESKFHLLWYSWHIFKKAQYLQEIKFCWKISACLGNGSLSIFTFILEPVHKGLGISVQCKEVEGSWYKGLYIKETSANKSISGTSVYLLGDFGYNPWFLTLFLLCYNEVKQCLPHRITARFPWL